MQSIPIPGQEKPVEETYSKEQLPLIKLRIHGFYTTYTNTGDGASIETDWVQYSPIGENNRTKINVRIERLKNCLHPSSAPQDRSVQIAYARWHHYIKPAYEAWKKGEELPEHGTPLAAWGGLGAHEVQALKAAGILTIEEFLGAHEGALNRINILNVRKLQTVCQEWVNSKSDTAKAADVADLKAMNEKLMKELGEQKDRADAQDREIKELNELFAEDSKAEKATKPKGKAA